MAQFIIDTDAFPLVVITYPVDASYEEIDAYLDALERALARGRIATVVDLRTVSVLRQSSTTPKHRQYLAAGLDERTARYPGRLVGENVVLNSSVLRGMYTAFNWMRRDLSYETCAFASVEAARISGEAQLRQAGLL